MKCQILWVPLPSHIALQIASLFADMTIESCSWAVSIMWVRQITSEPNLRRDMLISTKPQDLVVKDAAVNDKLNLGLILMKWLVV